MAEEQQPQAPREPDLSQPLPRTRADLEFYRGPSEQDGSPSFNIYDPLRSIYYKVTWAEMEVIRHLRPGMTLGDMMRELDANTTLKLHPNEISGFFMQLQAQGLLEGHKSADHIYEKSEKEYVGWFKWLLLHYLFIRIPLLNPDQFLTRTVKYVEPLFTKKALYIYLAISCLGLVILFTRWSDFIHTFNYFFNIQGILAYSLAIICTKVIHEFSHAYVAKKYGLRIPTMGIAFLVLWPVMYTDATDAWRLYSRNKRLAITAAGVLSETVIASLATIGWVMSTSGIWQSIFFVVASANWLATLLINVNPALRFDGYYLLSDFLRIENLHSRAFALARWEGYRIFFGIQTQDPEPKVFKGRRTFLCIFAVYTWIYRIFLYTAIALFVYHKFTKALGIFLFLLEIGVFFVWPIVDEFRSFNRIRPYMTWNPRVKATLIATAVFLVWFILPWPVHTRASAITIPYQNQRIYASAEGRIEELHVDRGAKVKKGDALVEITSENVDSKIEILELQNQILQKQLAIIQEDEEKLEYYNETLLELAQTESELEGYKQLRSQSVIRAAQDGEIYYVDEMLLEGQPISKNTLVAQMAVTDELLVVCFVPESELEYIEVGDRVGFRIRNTFKDYPGTIENIAPVRSSMLSYPQLASIYAGNLPVIEGEGKQLRLIDAFYSVRIRLDERGDIRLGTTGEVRFWGPWRSRALLAADYIISVLIGESGF